MVKRGAVEECQDVPHPKKRLPSFPYPDGDDFSNTSTTSASISDIDAASTVTGATTPRFPCDRKTLPCTWPGCGKYFNRPARLRDHLNSHTNSRPFQCPYEECDKDYIEDKHLKQHIKAVHTQDRKYECEQEGCGKKFVTGTRLKRHQAVHRGADRFRCQNCGQSFRKRETLNKHVRKDHQDLPAHQCPDHGCTKAFDSKGALNRHREREHGELKYWCGECGLDSLPDGTLRRVGFPTEHLLQAHIKQEHQDCMFCEYKSRTQGELDRHVEMQHSGKTVEDRKHIACSYDGCPKKFTRRSNLNTHIRAAHQGLRFTCGRENPSHAAVANTPELAGWSNQSGCGEEFVTKVGLEDHIKYVHLGLVRPKAVQMETDQTASTDLTSKMLGVQSPKTPRDLVSCPRCSDMFVRYADLRKHVARAHEHADADPAEFLSLAQLRNKQPFGDLNPEEHDWRLSGEGDVPDDGVEEEIFAAEMYYGTQRNDWWEDEANIMLLAREASPLLENSIDPAMMRS